MVEHTARSFDADLQQLARRIGEMGVLAEKQITDAIEALVKRDIALARQVITTDDRVDELQREIEEKAVITIARRQPMAVDLREIVGALRISNDLERIGDLAENLAKRVVLLTEEFQISEAMLQLQRMAQLVLGQMMRVLQSYESHDVAAALEVWRKDQEIDAMNNSLFRELLTYMMEDAKYHVLHAPAFLCQEHRAHRRSRHEYRGDRLLRRTGASAHRGAAKGRYHEQAGTAVSRLMRFGCRCRQACTPEEVPIRIQKGRLHSASGQGLWHGRALRPWKASLPRLQA